MATSRETFIILIALSCWQTAYGLRSFVVVLESVKSEFNSDIVKFLNLKIVDYNEHKAINGTFELLEDLHEFNVVTWVAKPNGKLWTMLNITLNGCKFLDDSLGRTNPLVANVFQEVKKHIPELPSKCPFKKDKVYTLLNFYLNEEMLPPYLPEHDFSSFFGLMRKKTYIFKIYLKGFVAAKSSQKYRDRTSQST